MSHTWSVEELVAAGGRHYPDGPNPNRVYFFDLPELAGMRVSRAKSRLGRGRIIRAWFPSGDWVIGSARALDVAHALGRYRLYYDTTQEKMAIDVGAASDNLRYQIDEMLANAYSKVFERLPYDSIQTNS